MSGVVDIQVARERRTRERLGRDIDRLAERYVEQHEAARTLVARDWDMSWIFFRSMAQEWAGQGGSLEALKAEICAQIDAACPGD